ncbi:hypothetical protein PR048_021719 [Dryococelus australis]|uniref:Uncharacterized protein n=1 Tax=Dryococelus australis TaxID=614101 RepID=A0ABQ9GZ26_9NEOP|nr:hypothetical protein PR048_021719 [Dryococelus australis]
MPHPNADTAVGPTSLQPALLSTAEHRSSAHSAETTTVLTTAVVGATTQQSGVDCHEIERQSRQLQYNLDIRKNAPTNEWQQPLQSQPPQGNSRRHPSHLKTHSCPTGHNKRYPSQCRPIIGSDIT